MSKTYVVSGGDVNYPIRMRKTASTSAAIVAQIPQNTVVDYLATNGGWEKVIYNGLTGYVQSKYVHVTDSSAVDTSFVEPTLSDIRPKLEEIEKSLKNSMTIIDKIFEMIGRG